MHHEALRNWIRQDEADRGRRDDRPAASELEELRRLRRENAESKRASEILKAALVSGSSGRCGPPACKARSCARSGASLPPGRTRRRHRRRTWSTGSSRLRRRTGGDPAARHLDRVPVHPGQSVPAGHGGHLDGRDVHLGRVPARLRRGRPDLVASPSWRSAGCSPPSRHPADRCGRFLTASGRTTTTTPASLRARRSDDRGREYRRQPWDRHGQPTVPPGAGASRRARVRWGALPVRVPRTS
ncbi:hypothetical protein [Plantactinospora sp. KBS50]|uniref:hypothetical protein n=1 Tax=Plantactinospora sp. KBS50 TaxID=2024580 RepID=UPI0035137D6B